MPGPAAEIDLIEYLARGLVETPDAIEVTSHEDDTVLELCVADDDVGRVIGRRGRTAKALRTLLAFRAGPNRRLELEIVGDQDPEEDDDDYDD